MPKTLLRSVGDTTTYSDLFTTPGNLARYRKGDL